MKSCIKRTIPLLLALVMVMVVGLLTPFSEASAASKKNVINYNISSSAVTSNATDGSLPAKASPVTGNSYYFNIQVSSDLKVKKFQLYVKDVGASSYSCVFTDTATNYMRYTSTKYTFSKAGTAYYYWKITYTDGSTKTTTKTSFTVDKGSNTITCSNVTLTKSSSKLTGNLNASAKDSAKLTYSSDTSKVTIDSKGNFTIPANWTGTATITITAAATSNYKKTTKKITITVTSGISTNYTGSGSTEDSKYYVTVNGTKFTAGSTFYTYNSSGSKKTTGSSSGYTYVKISEGSYVGSKLVTKTYYQDVGAWQCLAYAHNIQYLLYGKHDGSTSKINSGFKAVSGASGTLSSKTDDNVKSWITTAGAGAHIRVVTKSGNDHSLIVVSVTSKGFYYTDANSDNKGTIRIGYFSWSSFRSQYKSLSYIRYYAG